MTVTLQSLIQQNNKKCHKISCKYFLRIWHSQRSLMRLDRNACTLLIMTIMQCYRWPEADFFSAASTVTNLISTYIFLFKYLLSGPSGASSSTSIMQSDLQTPIIRTMWLWSNDAITRASFISSDCNTNLVIQQRWMTRAVLPNLLTKAPSIQQVARCSYIKHLLILECGPMSNVMAALPNMGGALFSMPQSLADAHY